MIYIRCPRIHNLGDFANCLPVLSGLYKSTGEKIHFSISNQLGRFNGLKQLLCLQEMFSDVVLEHEEKNEEYINIHDQNDEDSQTAIPSSTLRYANSLFAQDLRFEIDEDFELQVPKLGFNYLEDAIIVGDRWSTTEDPNLDARRASYMIKDSGVLSHKKTHQLDYSKDLVYNCSLVKYNPNVFVTTFTGIGILADLMKKNQYILWGDDLRDWAGKPIEYSFELHYFKNRNSKLCYVKDFKLQQ